MNLTATSEAENEEDTGVQEAPADRLQKLKERALTMGIKFSNNIGADALAAKIAAKLDNVADTTDADGVAIAVASAVAASSAATLVPAAAPAAPVTETARPKTRAELDQEIRAKQSAEQLKLIRCQIYNLDPSKRDLHGEFITVANKYVGTVRKFIPFGEASEGGFHLEHILVEELRARRFQSIKTHKDGGKIRVETRDVPEFNIVVMPQLTASELNELAITQQAAERVGV